MSGGVYVALSGAVAQQASLDATAENLANAQTAGYQRVRPMFHEALANAQRDANGDDYHSVGIYSQGLDTSRGALRTTGNALDVVTPDKSYLTVSTPGGERYTRAGSLKMATDGTLTTQGGIPLMGESGQVIKGNPAGTPMKITPAGEVMQDGGQIGRLKIAQFANPEYLSPEGSTLLAATTQSGAATPSKGELEVGQVEESNTSVVTAMTDLVNASRTFDAFQKAIDTFREADQKAATVPGDL